jgi:YHS domain-containing protein
MTIEKGSEFIKNPVFGGEKSPKTGLRLPAGRRAPRPRRERFPPAGDNCTLRCGRRGPAPRRENRRRPIMAIDPVCEMEVDEKKAKYKSEYEGKMYYFCSAGCKADFDAQPEDYVHG